MPTRPPTHRPPRPSGCSDGRASSTARGYGGNWPALRRVKLARDPVCEVCRREPAAHVDHHVSIASGGTYGMGNLVSMCHPCHSRKTCMVDGGFGRPKETR